MIRWLLLGLFVLIGSVTSSSADSHNGWRGNGTGLYPGARPPLEWYRIPKGVITDLRAQAEPPKDNAPSGIPLEKGIIRDWRVLGPFPIKHSVEDFAREQVPNEAMLHPGEGDRVWKTMTAQVDDRWAFGPANMPWADLGGAIGNSKANQVGYAHAYLYSPKGGTVRAVVDHMFGMKAWLNGSQVYSSAERQVNFGNYYALSRVEFGSHGITPSPRFELKLKPGWNRLLLKVSTFHREDANWKQQNFAMRLMDLPNVPYDSKNILWMTELPHRSNATPIVVGDRVFVMSEPDELICLDKNTGKVLWSAATNYYELLTPAERAANPAFAQKIEPMLAELRKEADIVKRINLRGKLQKTLTEIDADRFAWKADGHFEAHFGIVGFATPSPVSDGKHVYVWCGNAVAACYNLSGERQWITRVPVSELSYPSSPALADGIFAVYLGKLFGLDAKTGQVRWVQKKADVTNGAVLAADIAGVPVFVTSLGNIVRARDGKLLYRERERSGGASSWAPPAIVGDIVYLPRYGIKGLLVLDFTGSAGEEWTPKRLSLSVPDGVGRKPDGTMVDRPTCGSPLLFGDQVSMVDIYSTYYNYDLKAMKMSYLQDTELNGLFHYNAVPVAASPVLIGKHIVIQDNQGLALVLEAGKEFRQVGKNRIATQLDRWWPVPAQETVGYSPPVPDGNRLYIRGERYLYCIGEK